MAKPESVERDAKISQRFGINRLRRFKIIRFLACRIFWGHGKAVVIFSVLLNAQRQQVFQKNEKNDFLFMSFV